MFHLLLELISGDSEKVEMLKELERQETYSLILGYADGIEMDPKLREPHRKEASKLRDRLRQIDIELDQLRNGKEGKTLQWLQLPQRLFLSRITQLKSVNGAVAPLQAGT